MRSQKRHVGSLQGERMSLVRGALGQAALVILVEDCGMDPEIADRAVADVMDNRVRQARTLRAIYRRAIKLGGVDRRQKEEGGSQKEEGRATAGTAPCMADGSASPDGSGAGDGQSGAGTEAPLVLLGPGGDYCTAYTPCENAQCSMLNAQCHGPDSDSFIGHCSLNIEHSPSDQAAGLRTAMRAYAGGLRA